MNSNWKWDNTFRMMQRWMIICIDSQSCHHGLQLSRLLHPYGKNRDWGGQQFAIQLFFYNHFIYFTITVSYLIKCHISELNTMCMYIQTHCSPGRLEVRSIFLILSPLGSFGPSLRWTSCEVSSCCDPASFTGQKANPAPPHGTFMSSIPRSSHY